MTRFGKARPDLLFAFLCLAVLLPAATAVALPPTGFQAELGVSNRTRLDWQFAAAGFGRDAARLTAGYESRNQRYQLYVPKAYHSEKAWPLVVFISPGDDPLGWRYWQKPCEEANLLFCAAYGAGNNCPAGQRIRIVLDMLDDVRRHYRIDPDQTYLCGFSGGGRVACTIAYALPEYFGGVVPVCGTNPLNGLAYLRHRVHDRLSVAFVTGATDFNRKENEEYMAPLFKELGIRSRLWVAPNMGHAIPGPKVLAEVSAWLADDLPRRRAAAKAHPGLVAAPESVPSPSDQAARLVEAAEAELKKPAATWRGVALLQGTVTRWGDTPAGEKARKLLEDIQKDPHKVDLLVEQGGAEERQMLAAQGKAFERLGDHRKALQAWELLAKQHADTPEGREAGREAKRLRESLASTPYLGVAFTGETAAVAQVVPKGPADRAGVKTGDVLVKVADGKVASAAEVKRALERSKPGDSVKLQVRRAGKELTLTLELGSIPTGDDK